MRIAIVHYHLAPGGVTSVIRAACRELAATGVPHVVLCGASPVVEEEVPVRIIPGLQYLTATDRSATSLLAEMKAAASEALGGLPDVWHFHNHSLGKNCVLPAVVSLLAQAGERLFLQIHDVAEDGRPGNYSLLHGQSWLYPVSPRILYGFINEKDRGKFISAGLPEENAVFLPNPVPRMDCGAPATAEKTVPLILYPTRAIRRKNLGELLLLSLFAPSGSQFAVTRVPEDPGALAIHDHWKWLAEQMKLPIQFGVVDRIPPAEGGDASLASWITASTHWITTSIAEGFGMIFPEAASLGKPVIGRKLSTNPQPGLRSLYREILIPAEWIHPGELRRRLSQQIGEIHRLYQCPQSSNAVDRAYESLQRGMHMDFGNLPEALQCEVLIYLRDHPSARPWIDGKPADAWMREALQQPPCPYGGQGIPSGEYGPTLAEHYRALCQEYGVISGDSTGKCGGAIRHGKPERDAPATAWGRMPQLLSAVEPKRVLDAYLSPENFHFLQTSPRKLRAVVFDIYGTLLIAPPGAVKPDPVFDPELCDILSSFGHDIGTSPTRVLHDAVLRNHAKSGRAYPEIDLLRIWQEILNTEEDTTTLAIAVEKAWHPCEPMPQARETIHRLSAVGVLLGVLSNAQANTLPALDETLGPVTHLLAPGLTLLSYQHGISKPSPELFQSLSRSLEERGISPNETLFVGNDPEQDINPAQAAGFRTALFIGHYSSLRSGECSPDLLVRNLSEIPAVVASF